jgi:hypothetical protein
MEYTDKSEPILEALRLMELEPGMYALGKPAGMEPADIAFWEENNLGKYWGILNYQESQGGMEEMKTNLLRGFAIDLVIMFLLFSMMAKVNATSMKDALFITVGIGLIAFMVEPYTYFIWFKMPGIFAHLADAVVPLSLIGLVWWKIK